jgi:hypothetical protein
MEIAAAPFWNEDAPYKLVHEMPKPNCDILASQGNGGKNPPILEESNVGDDLDHERGGSVL